MLCLLLFAAVLACLLPGADAVPLKNLCLPGGDAPPVRRRIFGHESLPLRVELNDWDSHDLTSYVFAILAKEKLGYDVDMVRAGTSHLVDRLAGCTTAELAGGGNTCRGLSADELATRAPESMLNMEVWPTGKGEMIEYWTVSRTDVHDLGPSGVVGESGWCVRGQRPSCVQSEREHEEACAQGGAVREYACC